MSQKKHRHRWNNPQFSYESRATRHNYPTSGTYRECFPERYERNIPTLSETCSCGASRQIFLDSLFPEVEIKYAEPQEYRTGEFYRERVDRARPHHIASVVAAEIAYNMTHSVEAFLKQMSSD